MSDMSMLINGLKVSAENNATFERRNPLDGTVATRAPAASAWRIAAMGAAARVKLARAASPSLSPRPSLNCASVAARSCP